MRRWHYRLLVVVRYERLITQWRPNVARIPLTWRQFDGLRREIPVRDHAEQMLDAVEPGPLLDISFNDIPGGPHNSFGGTALWRYILISHHAKRHVRARIFRARPVIEIWSR